MKLSGSKPGSEDKVDQYYRLKKEMETRMEEKTEELKELLVRQNTTIKFLKEELDQVKSQNSKLKDFKGLAPLTGILNLLNLKSDPDLYLLVRGIVLEGLQVLTSNSDSGLSR